MPRIAGALLAGLFLAFPPPARAADAPPAGTWKLSLPIQAGAPPQALWLVKLEDKGGKWTGAVTARDRNAVPAAVDNVSVEKGALRFTLKVGETTFRFEGKVPREGGKIRGTVSTRQDVSAAELEPTTLTSFDPYDVAKEYVAQHAEGIQLVQTALNLLHQAEDHKARPEEVRSWAAKAVKAAGDYGPAWQRNIQSAVATVLSRQKEYAPIALEYARRAERLLEPTDRPSQQKRVLESLALALANSGRADEAKEVEARIKKIDLTIKPKPYAGRKGKSDRAVLVELFTGVHCQPCVAADLTLDALGKTFKPSQAVLLEYHLHVSGPDPLTNPAAEARARFYRLRTAPTLFLGGQPGPAADGSVEDGPEKYEEYVGALAPLLERPAGAKLTLDARRKGDKVEAKVSASGVQEEDDVVLRVVLVEEQVDYAGANKLPAYRHVVRAFLGKPEGVKVAPGKAVEQSYQVDLAEVRKGLKEYLDKYDKEAPAPTKDRPLALKNLKVVAFVQSDRTRAVLQAAQADVPGE
jgi:hypothetical protein